MDPQHSAQKTLRFINVPYDQKDDAKALGARWHVDSKKWYVPISVDIALFVQWSGDTQPAPTTFTRPRDPNKLLAIDLVPRSAWFSNLRSEISADEWKLVQRASFLSAQYCCEVCGGKGPHHPVECHERWHYDAKNKVQTLLGTIALCPACHETTHFGLAKAKGRDGEARKHLMRVNNWAPAEADRHIAKAWADWRSRNEIDWHLDSRWLLGYVVISEATQKKILNHAAGLGDRVIEGWQREIVEGEAGWKNIY